MSTGIKLLCADQSTGVLRWPVTRTCAPGNLPTRVIIGAEKSGQPVSSTTTSPTVTPVIVVAAPSTGGATSTTSTTTTTTVPSNGGGLIAYGGTGSDYPFDSVVDGSGNLYTTGYFQGTVDFDPGAGTSSLTSAGGNDVFVSKLDSAGNFVWAVRFGASTGEIAYGIAVDGSGNVYTTGYFSGTVDFDPGAGTSNLTTGGGNDVFISKLTSSGNFVWAKSFGQLTNDIGFAIAVDGSGNVYSTGYFQNSVDFDPGVGTNNLTSAGAIDIYVSKLDASGSFLWAKSFGGAGNEVAYEIAFDGSGNVYSTGYFQNTVDFDPGPGTSNLTASSTDAFVSKLDASGSFVWAKSFGGIGGDYGKAIALDGSGNVYVTGNFQVTVDFDPGVGTLNLTSAGSDDVFVSKLDASGSFVWAKRFGSTSADISQSIAVDGSGNVHTTGSFNGSVDFDPGAGSSLLTSAGSDDAFVSKLTSSGDFEWAIRLGGNDSDGGQSIEVDSSGNVRTVCYFSGSADVDPGTGTTLVASNGQTDVFVWQVDSSGTLRS